MPLVGITFGGTDYGIGKYDDWAVVKLEQPVTVSVSYLGLRPVNSASEMSSLGYSTQGDPCDKNGCDEPGAIWDNSSMYRTTGYILGDKARYLDLVTTNIDMYKVKVVLRFGGTVQVMDIARKPW